MSEPSFRAIFKTIAVDLFPASDREHGDTRRFLGSVLGALSLTVSGDVNQVHRFFKQDRFSSVFL